MSRNAYRNAVAHANHCHLCDGGRIEKKDLIDPENSRRYYHNYNLPRFVTCGGWQVLCEYNGSDEFQQWYAYGNYIDEVLAMGTGIFASTVRFYIHDHLCSPVALTDYSGSVLERYEYDAYGKSNNQKTLQITLGVV